MMNLLGLTAHGRAEHRKCTLLVSDLPTYHYFVLALGTG